MKYYAQNLIVGSLILGAVSAIVWTIVWAGMNYHRGVYAGSHFNDARRTALTYLLAKYGADPIGLKEGKPNVRNTHMLGQLGGPQIRIFKFLVKGKPVCVATWDGDSKVENVPCRM